MTTRSKLARGTAWITAARMLTNALGLASTLFLARLLAPADFGIVAIANTLIVLLNTLTDLSMSNALVQHSEPSADHYDTAFTLNLIRSLLLAIVFSAASLPAAHIFHEPRLVPVMCVLGAGLIFTGFNNPRSVMLTKQLVFWQMFWLQVSQKLVGLIAAVTIATLYRSYWALVAGTVAAEFTGAVVSYFVLPHRPRLKLNKGRELFAFSMWLTGGQMVNAINNRIDQLLIGGFLGRTALGYYTVGDNLATLPTREATAPITGTLFPAFARLKNDPVRLAGAYQSAQALVTAVALPAGVGVGLIAEPLVLITIGAKWLPAVLPIRVLSAVFALQTLGSLSQPLAMAAGRTRLLFLRDLQNFVVRIPFILGGLALGGLPGLIYARAITGMLAVALHMNVVRQVTGLSLPAQLRANVRSLASAAAMAVVVALLDRFGPFQQPVALSLTLRLIIDILAGGSTYLSVHIGSWLLAGRPSGPEAEVLAGLRALSDRIWRRRS